jgi:hypothetical protein
MAASQIATQAESDDVEDVTSGATYYYDKRMPSPPAWAKGKTPCYACGNHLFFNDID